MRFLKLKRVWLGLFCLILLGLLSSCAGTRTLLTTAPTTPKGTVAKPVLTISSKADWEGQKQQLRERFEQEVYGVMPKDFSLY